MKPKYPTRDRHYGNGSRSKKYLSSSIVIDRAAYSSSDPVLQKPVNNLATLVLPVGAIPSSLVLVTIANAELPSAANTILDFQIGTDIIGIQGAKSLGISATSLKLNQVGTDATINFGFQTLAVLTGIQASSLTPGNANQFVFA